MTRSSKHRIILAALMVCICASLSSRASTLDDYTKRIDSARSGISVLLANVSLEEAGQPLQEPKGEVFAELHKLIPASERVETSSGAIETDNRWFTDGLASAEQSKELTKRAALLTELEKRLASLQSEIDDLRAAVSADRSKDDDKRKLAEIMQRPEYQPPPKKEESQAESLITRLLRWIDSWFPKFEPPAGSGEFLGSVSGVVQVVIILAVLALLAFVAYKLIPLFAPRFRKRLIPEAAERVILGEKIGEDVSASDLFGEADRLAREGDLRGAIRKGYVALLCELSDRKLIGLARHKTNRDYLRDVRNSRNVYSQMNGLTGSFERHWYGSQTAVPQDWDEFRRGCDETIKAI